MKSICDIQDYRINLPSDREEDASPTVNSLSNSAAMISKESSMSFYSTC